MKILRKKWHKAIKNDVMARYKITAHDRAVDKRNGKKMAGHRYARHVLDAIHKKYHITPRDRAIDRRNMMKYVKHRK